MKLIDWLKDGGGEFIGFDSSGDRMYSISNGEALLFWIVMGLAAVGVVAMVVLAWRCFYE